MKLTHLGISYYRSIGKEPVTLDLTKKLNVLVGANNCGKSNVLRALGHLNGKERDQNYIDADFHALIKSQELTFKFSGVLTNQYGGELPAWFDFILRSKRPFVTSGFWNEWSSEKIDQHLRKLGKDGVGRYHLNGSDLEEFKQRQGQEIIRPAFESLPNVLLIPQFRKIDAGSSAYEVDGRGIVARLASWDRPKFGQREERKKLIQIRNLLRELVQESDAEIEVSRETSEILITVKDLQLPLESFGTGIHEIIILAIAVLSVENTVVCVEEPEIHLHPLLQRRFLDFLRKNTTNRYILTTHSPALIAPAEDTNVIHLWLENGVTQSRSIETTSDSLRALHDLGAQASDLLQANSVIWVEGPSDRTYLNCWLELLHPKKYREGIDYTVMFYGGRLLSHLSMGRDRVAETKEDEGAELIQLLKINQHSAILIDSDRRKAADVTNSTKERIKTECTASGVFCWITPGREIENCLPVAAIEAAFGTLAGTPVSIKLKPYQDIEDALATSLKSVWKRAKYYEHAKAQRAHEISGHIKTDQLSREVRDLVAGIVKVIEHKLR